jgi:hypothetical protein
VEILLLLLVIPVGWPFIAKAVWKQEYSFQELSMNVIIAALLATGLWYAGRYVEMRDVEIVNGAVTGKSRNWVPCSHSHSCNCRKTGKNSRTCDTCYDHSNDYDWVLKTSVDGKTFEISRVDRQGLREPPRYSAAQIGDPVAVEHAHVNYVKAASGSLFHDKGEVLTNLPIPTYPNTVFDYHYVNRVLSAGVAVPDIAEWNRDIAMALREVGPRKQVNFVVAFANSASPTYAQALERAWINGKKNDVIVVLGTPKYPEISWVRVLSWTDRQDFKVRLRDDILDLKTVDREKIVQLLVSDTDLLFKRKLMSDFEYLKWEIDPPLWASILAFILSGAASIGLSVYFSRNTVTYKSVFGALVAALLGLATFAFVSRSRRGR